LNLYLFEKVYPACILLHGKNMEDGFVEVSKNLIRYRFENYFVGPSK